MRFVTILLASGALVAGPLAAQESEPGGNHGEPKADARKTIYDGWEAEQRAAYDRWLAAVKDYFWTLPPQRQQLFFRLSDSDKLAIVGMSAGDRESAWAKVESRAKPPGAPGGKTAPPPRPPAADGSEAMAPPDS